MYRTFHNANYLVRQGRLPEVAGRVTPNSSLKEEGVLYLRKPHPTCQEGFPFQ
jgi:hypothetical protein